MGSGIATSLILSGVGVLLKEVTEEFLKAGVGRVTANLQSRVKKGAMREADMTRALSLVTPVLDYGRFREADMVIEAVIESLPLKQSIFAECEKHCTADCVLSTNTSTIDISLVGAKMQRPERIVGAHFFSPAHIMPLLEIIRTKNTPAQVGLVQTKESSMYCLQVRPHDHPVP